MARMREERRLVRIFFRLSRISGLTMVVVAHPKAKGAEKERRVYDQMMVFLRMGLKFVFHTFAWSLVLIILWSHSTLQIPGLN